MPSRIPTLEAQKARTPTTQEELEAFGRSIAEAKESGVPENLVMQQATLLYNTQFYRQELTEGAPNIRAPTTVEKAKKTSKKAAKGRRDREVAASLEPVKEASPGTAVPSSSANTATKPPARKRIRRDRDSAKERVARGTPLKVEEINSISDTVAICYMKDMKLSTSGNVGEKRKALTDYFSSRGISEYIPVVTSPSPVVGPPSGHISI